ncbi:PspC domain-containing protein [Nonomuraea cavernae]|uniref:PspC domain-containing protein n=1 Tax=Nonomuraea cavernae TaxID=2045107 RepID=UPI0033F5B316
MTEAPAKEPAAPPRVLRRSGEGRFLMGVCAGLGRYTGIDPVVFRAGFAVLLFGSGVGLFLYIAAFLLMKDPDGRPGYIEHWSRRDFDADTVMALLTAVLAFGLAINLTTVWLDTGTLVVGLLLAVALLAAHSKGVDLLGLARSMPERLTRRQAAQTYPPPPVAPAPGFPQPYPYGEPPVAAAHGSVGVNTIPRPPSSAEVSLSPETPPIPDPTVPHRSPVPSATSPGESVTARIPADDLPHADTPAGDASRETAPAGDVPPEDGATEVPREAAAATDAPPAGSGDSPGMAVSRAPREETAGSRYAGATASGFTRLDRSVGDGASGGGRDGEFASYGASGGGRDGEFASYGAPFAPHGPYRPHDAYQPLDPSRRADQSPYDPALYGRTMPPHRPRRPRPRSFIGAITMLLAIIIGGIVVAVQAGSSPGVNPIIVGGAVLVTIGAGLLIAAWWGRGTGLVASGTAVALMVALGLTLGGLPKKVGDSVWNPVTAAEASKVYNVGAGSGRLDLSELKLTPGTKVTFNASVSIGDLTVITPPTAKVEVHATNKVGDIQVGQSLRSGVDVRFDTVLDPETPPVGKVSTIVLNLKGGFGDMDVRHAA